MFKIMLQSLKKVVNVFNFRKYSSKKSRLFNPRLLFTRRDIAEHLNISTSTVKRYMFAAQIKPISMRGNKNIYGKKEVFKFLDFYYNSPKNMKLYS